MKHAATGGNGTTVARALLQDPQDPGISNNNALHWCISSTCRIMAIAEKMCATAKDHVLQLWDGSTLLY